MFSALPCFLASFSLLVRAYTRLESGLFVRRDVLDVVGIAVKIRFSVNFRDFGMVEIF